MTIRNPRGRTFLQDLGSRVPVIGAIPSTGSPLIRREACETTIHGKLSCRFALVVLALIAVLSLPLPWAWASTPETGTQESRSDDGHPREHNDLPVQQATSIVRITGTSISKTQTRDGQTITLNYEISSSASVSASLGCTLTGPSGEIIEDDTHEGPDYDVTLSAGEHWYHRDFFVNMPPGARTGAYDVEWGVSWGTTGFTSVGKPDALTVLSPIPVRVPILMYHKVGPVAYSEYWVARDRFGAQMRALKAYGYTAVTLQDVMDYRAGVASPPAKPVVITFDDAYQNLLTDAYPELESAGVETATSFVPTGKVGGNNAWDTDDNNPVIPHLTWDDIHSLDSTGRIVFESHTVTHPYLRTVGSQTLNYELTASAETLEDELGHRPRFISWPYGQTNSPIESAARTADYFAAVVAWDGVEETCANKWELSRVYVDWNSSVDYDPSHPDYFFFNLIEEDIPIPSITVNSITYLDPSTGNPLPGNQVYRGSTVKVRVGATNTGQASRVAASLSLDNDADTSSGVVFDSHASGRDITADFPPGTSNFDWTWKVPADAPLGRYHATASFHDQNYVLGFGYSNPLWQQAFDVKIPGGFESIGQIKALPNSHQYVCVRAMVSAAFPTMFYLESDDRAIGIQVYAPDHGMSPGDIAVVEGTMHTDSGGERYVEATDMYKDGTGSTRPIGMPNRSLGGNDWKYDPTTGAGQLGVYGGSGPNNVGLLVTVWGKITQVGSGYLYIDDGAALQDGTKTGVNKNTGVRVVCDPGALAAGEYVTVTGVGLIFRTPEGRNARMVLPQSADDIKVKAHM